MIEVKPVLITREALEKNDPDKKLRGFGVSDLATASWLTAPAEKTQ